MGLPSVWKALREEARNVVLSGSVDEEQHLIAEAVDGQANTLNGGFGVIHNIYIDLN